ncbi:MAG: hypothetical protein FWD78_04405 [Treponema sp.]|nr:hypothetical protein [Treponema sp.]
MKIKRIYIAFFVFLFFFGISSNISGEEKMIPSVMTGYDSLERVDNFRGGNIFAFMIWVEEGYYSKNNSQNIALVSYEIKKLENEYQEDILKTLQSIYSEDRVRYVEVSILSEGINVIVNIDGINQFKYNKNGKFIFLPNGLRERIYTPISLEDLLAIKKLIRNCRA